MLSIAPSQNPFHQPEKICLLRFHVPASLVEMTEKAFEDVALAVSSFAIKEEDGEWKVEILCAETPDAEEMKRRLTLLSLLAGKNLGNIDAQVLEQKDWVSEVQKQFPPLAVDRFYVHGSHHVNQVPLGKTGLHIDAGAAFGSGEHATTSGCLTALAWLQKRRKFHRILDMGTGSGILAVAAAKLWNAPVIAVDIDPVSVRVAAENMGINHVEKQVATHCTDGYKAREIHAGAPFDLIIANILAKPLMKMSADLAAHLAPKGVVVLSGLLAPQENMVRSAHRLQGLKLVRRFSINGWNTLVLSF